MVVPKRHKTSNTSWISRRLQRCSCGVGRRQLIQVVVAVVAVLLLLIGLTVTTTTTLPALRLLVAPLSQSDNNNNHRLGTINNNNDNNHRSFISPEQQLRRNHNKNVVLEEGQPPVWVPPRPAVSKREAAKISSTSTNGIHGKTTTTASTVSTSTRYLIFRPPFEAAQGVGNIMNGLLAAHILGREFDRIVCVSTEWQAFHSAFESLVPQCRDYYSQQEQQQQQQSDTKSIPAVPPRTAENTIWLLNFSKNPINECDLKETLQQGSRDEYRAIYLVGNTYPGGWPTTSTTTNQNRSDHDLHLFSFAMEDLYRPKQNLLKAIPWTTAPTTVVHLRQADKEEQDHRAGLDSATLAALGETLACSRNDTTTPFLVSNQVSFYYYFETKFGWSHPPWTGTIRHSAISTIQWSSRIRIITTGDTVPPHDENSQASRLRPPLAAGASTSEQQTLQVWADWWTIYMARTVYHTHSDFSASAARWRSAAGGDGRNPETDSYEIGGLDDQEVLVLHKETWWWQDDSNRQHNTIRNHDGANGAAPAPKKVFLPLSERSPALLQHCDVLVTSWKSSSNGLGDVLDLDDHMHDDDLVDK